MNLSGYNVTVLLIAVIPAVVVELGAVSPDNALFFYLMCIIGILLAIREQLIEVSNVQDANN